MKEYEVWFRDPRTVVHNMLANPDFNDEFDYAPFRQFDEDGRREFKDYMSAGHSWKLAVSFTPSVSSK
jgi:hypothetical protein